MWSRLRELSRYPRIYESVLERVCEIVLRGFDYLPISGSVRACWYKRITLVELISTEINNIVATILSRGGTKVQQDFATTISELFRFRDWLRPNDCKAVALESTGTYWYLLNSRLHSSRRRLRGQSCHHIHDWAHNQEEKGSHWLGVDCRALPQWLDRAVEDLSGGGLEAQNADPKPRRSG